MTVQGQSTAIESISFRTSRRLVLRLAESVESGDVVVLTSTAAIEDLSGNRETSPPQMRAVTNNTPAAIPSLSLSVADDSVEEGQTLTLTATLSASVDHEITVPLRVLPSVALLDGNPVITIPAGATEAELELRSRQVTSRVFDFSFTIRAQASEFYSGTPHVSVTLEDRDARYQYRVLSASNLADGVERPQTVSQGGVYHIRVTGPSDAPPSALGVSLFTEGITATAGQDYLAKSQRITVRQDEFIYSEQRGRWEASVRVLVQILPDEIVEGDETLILYLTASPGTALDNLNLCRSTRCAQIMTIVDDDLRIQTAVEAMDGGSQASVSEGDGAVGVDFVATLPEGASEGRELEFVIETVAGTAASPADYGLRGTTGTRTTVRVGRADYRRTGTDGTGSLEARKTIWLDVVDDDIVEGTESFVVHLRESVRSSNYIRPVSGKQQVSVQIADNDTRAVIVSPTLLELPPGGERTYMVSLATEPTGDVTVTLDGPDEAGLDAVPESLTFTVDDWQTEKAVSVSAGEEFAPPDEDTIGHTVAGADYAGVAADSVTVRAVSEDAPPQSMPDIFIADASADEGADALSFTVSLSEISTQRVTVRYRTDDGTAQAGQDYTAVSGTLTFEPNEQTKTISVALLDDNSDEPAESLSVILSVSTNAEISDDAATGTITDNDGPPTISIRGGSAFEGASGVPFYIDLSAQSGFPVTMRYETVEILAANGGATEGMDFDADVGTLTIAPGTESTTVLVSIIDDSRDEFDETLGLAVTAPVNALLGATAANAVGTILDDDDPPDLILTGARAAEAAGGVSFTFTLSEASNLPVVAQFETSDGTAAAGSDYERTTGSVTIPAGQTKVVRGVRIFQDTLTEPDEDFYLSVNEETLQNAGFSNDDSDPVAVIEDSPLPALAIGDATATEASGMIHFPISVTGTSASAVTVSWTTEDGTALAASDYTAASGTLTIAAGTTERQITITLLKDDTAESDETFSVVLSGASGAALTDTTGVGTITEGALPVVSVATATASEDAASMTFTVSLDKLAAADVRVRYQSSDVTATVDEDYLEASGFLTIASGSMTGEVSVSIVADSFDEPNETLRISLSDARNATLGTSQATGTIEDDDPLPSLSIGDADAAEGGTLNFAVSLSPSSRRQVTVQYTTADGTATVEQDYTSASGTLTFEPGQETKRLFVTLLQDSVHEGSETLSVTLSQPGNADVSETSGSGTGTILDDDTRAVDVRPTELDLREGTTRLYSVVLTTEPTGPVTVTTMVRDDSDVSTDPASLTFTAENWHVAQTVAVSAARDLDAKAETATVAHTVGGADYASVTAESVTVNVSDEDTASTAIALRVSPPMVAEDGGDQTITVEASLNAAVLEEPAAVTVTVAGGTATAGGDFATVMPFSVTIAAGSGHGTGTFTLAPVDDDLDEGDGETVAITGTTIVAGLAVTGTEVTIADDDVRGVRVQPTTLVVAEGSHNEYSVVLESKPTGDVMVDVTLSGNTDVSVMPERLTFGPDTWSAAQTVTVAAILDTDAANEDATVSHTTSGADYEGISTDSVSVTVVDGQRTAMGIVLGVSPEEVGEDDPATTVTVTATLDGGTLPAATTVTVTVGKTGDGATEGTDYRTVDELTVTIPVGMFSGTATFTLTPVPDTVAEGAETISVEGVASGFEVTNTAVTLTDDETAPTSITLGVSPGTVSEGDAATTVTVTATLDGSAALPDATTVTVTVGKTGDGATEGTDYQTVDDLSVTIPVGMLSGTATFTVTPEQDTVAEGTETISVAGAASGFEVTDTEVTLTDDETAPTSITLGVSPGTVSEGDAATPVTATATLDGSAALPDATTVTVTVGKTGDGATEGTDYETVDDLSVTIPGGMLSGTATFTVTPEQDTVAEGTETISVEGAAIGFEVTDTEVTLTDDETAPTSITLSVSPAEVRENDPATTVTVTATLGGTTPRQAATIVTVTVGKTGDGATEGTDYQTVGDLSVTIPGGMLSGTGAFTLEPVLDKVAEDAETISVEGAAIGFEVTDTEVTLNDNAAPVATNSEVTTAEDTTYTFAATDFGFTDSDGDGLVSVEVVTVPGAGSLTLNSVAVNVEDTVTKAQLDAGELEYAPVANANGAGYASFTFKVSDGTDESAAAATMTINVTAVNDDPTGAPTITGTARVGQTLSASRTGIGDVDGLPANESDYAYQWVRVDGGTETDITGATTSTYEMATADEGKKLKVEVSYTDGDGTPETVPSAETATVAANTAPVATNSEVTTAEDTAYTFAATDFAFTDGDGDGLVSVEVVTVPGAGSLTLNSAAVNVEQTVTKAQLDGGELEFTPAADANGVPYTTFTFKVSDGPDESAAATMTIDVTAVNDDPTGAPVISGPARVGHTLSASRTGIGDVDGLPANESDYGYQWLRVDSGVDTDITGATTSTYLVATADEGKKLKVEVSYTDGDGTPEEVPSAETATVGTNTAPVATNSEVTTDEDTTYTFKAADFEFTDDDGDVLSQVTVTTVPGAGSLTLNSVTVNAEQTVTKAQLDGGELAFTPAADANGAGYASFTFKVSDGAAESAAAATMTIDVTAVNDDPTGAPTISGTVRVGQTLSASRTGIGDLDGLPANESDYAYQWVRVDGGTETDITGATTSTYEMATADEGKKLKVEVSYTDGDGTPETVPSAETATVAANTAPVATNSEVTTAEDTAYTFAATDFAFTDGDGDGLVSVEVVTVPGAGSLTLNSVAVNVEDTVTKAQLDGAELEYAPAADANGVPYTTFTFKVSDGTDESAAATMTINVTAVNDDPTGAPVITGPARVGHTLSASRLGIGDVDGLPANESDYGYQWVRVDSGVGTDITGATTSTYEVAAADEGKKLKVEVSYTDDGGTPEEVASAETATVGTNTAPVATNSAVTTAEDTAYTFAASDFAFTDGDGDALVSVEVTTVPGVGSLTLNSVTVNVDDTVTKAQLDGGELAFTPVADANGVPYTTFTFKVSDGADESAAATMTIDVTAVNDDPTGAPVITGPARVGHTLSASRTGIGDVDGLPPTRATTPTSGCRWTAEWTPTSRERPRAPTRW